MQNAENFAFQRTLSEMQLVQQLEGPSCDQALEELPLSTRKSASSFSDFRCDSSNNMHAELSNFNCFEKPNINAEEEQRRQIRGDAFDSTNKEDFRTAGKLTACEEREILQKSQTGEKYKKESERSLGSSLSEFINPAIQATPDEAAGWQVIGESNTDTSANNLKMELEDKIEELASVKLHNGILRKELHKTRKFEELYNQLKFETDNRELLVEDLQAENMALKEQVMQFQEDFEAERRAYKNALREKKLKERDCKVYEQERDQAIRRAQHSEFKQQELEREILALNERIRMMTMSANPIVSRSASERISKWVADMGDKDQFYTMDTSEINLDVHSSNYSDYELLEEDGAVGGERSKMRRVVNG